MNRKERRAIEFGNAFAPTRKFYQYYRHTGIAREQYSAWVEYCNKSEKSERDALWDWQCPDYGISYIS